MTPWIGASGADWSTALAPGLDRPGLNLVPRTPHQGQRDPQDWSVLGEAASGQMLGTRTGTSGKAKHPDWNIRRAEALD